MDGLGILRAGGGKGGVNCCEVQPVHWDGVGFASRPARGVWFIPDE